MYSSCVVILIHGDPPLILMPDNIGLSIRDFTKTFSQTCVFMCMYSLCVCARSISHTVQDTKLHADSLIEGNITNCMSEHGENVAFSKH